MLVSLLYMAHYALWIYMLMVIARALLSWVNPDPYNPVIRFLHQATDPVLYAVRRKLPLPMTGIDYTPVVVIILITFLDSFVMKTIQDISFGVPVSLFANGLYALVVGIHDILRIYMIIIIARAIISWVNPDPYNPIVRFLYDVTEPVLCRVRQLIPLPAVGIDFSPVVVIVLIVLVDKILLRLV